MVTTLVLVLLSAPPPGHAGRVVAVNGNVTLTRSDVPTPVTRGDYIVQGDVIATGADGNVRLLMRDKSVLALTAKSSIAIAAYDVEPATRKRRARLPVLVGRLWALVSKTVHPDASYEVTANNAVAGVRGTELVFDVGEAGESEVTVISGEVTLASADARETLGERERGQVVGAGAIALKSTTEDAIADIHDAIRPEQELDTAKAEKRLKATRKRAADEDPASARIDEERDTGRDDPGTGDAVLEDTREGGFTGDNSPTVGFFDPSTMGRVRVHVEVRE